MPLRACLRKFGWQAREGRRVWDIGSFRTRWLHGQKFTHRLGAAHKRWTGTSSTAGKNPLAMKHSDAQVIHDLREEGWGSRRCGKETMRSGASAGDQLQPLPGAVGHSPLASGAGAQSETLQLLLPAPAQGHQHAPNRPGWMQESAPAHWTIVKNWPSEAGSCSRALPHPLPHLRPSLRLLGVRAALQRLLFCSLNAALLG